MTDWAKVLKYLEPKSSEYCPEEPSLTQKVFLRTNALEALFGGSAGGGKSSALLMSALQFVDIPDYSAILFRRTYADLALPGALMDRFVTWIGNYDDVRWNSNMYTATFPSGARISFGYLNNRDDYLRYKGCLVEGTEILTSTGWKKIENVAVGEMVASMDPETRTWDYRPVTHTWTYDHDGPIYGPRPGSDISFAATDNHNWWVSTPKTNKLQKFRTDELPEIAGFPQAAQFVGGTNPGASIFPSSSENGQNGSDLIFHPEAWANFLGFYIATGHTNGSEIHLTLRSDHTETHKAKFHELADLVEAETYDNQQSLRFTNEQLAAWLQEHVGNTSPEKKIPTEVFSWTEKHAYMLLDLLVETDKRWSLAANLRHTTTSPQFADDIMRLAQHCGFTATLDEQTGQFGERTLRVQLAHKANNDATISGGKNEPSIASEHYTGTVHCITVPPHHTFLIRHNGRVVWTGNSEFQFIGMDEVTEIRESDYRYMFSRLRRPASGPLSQVPLRMRAASNPAPNWVRQRFIVEGKEKGRIFVPSRLTDNPGIDAQSYRISLQELDPVERRRLEEGDWWATSLGTLFERESFIIIDAAEIPQTSSASRFVRFWDLAGSEPSHSNPDPDWTVGTLMIFDQGIAYVIDVRKIRAKGDRVEHLLAQTALEDGHAVAIRMEQEPGSAGKNLIDQYARYVLQGYDFAGIRSTGDKLTRARPFAAAVANGNVRVVRGPWLTDWLDEFASFPEAANHDDQVDSAVGAFNYIAGLGLPQRTKVSIIV